MRSKKQGFGVIPLKYPISFNRIASENGKAQFKINENGIISLQIGGVEMGQGLFTKISQIASYAFGVHVKYFDISSFNWLYNDPSNQGLPGTGASTGTDLNGGAVKKLGEQYFLEYLKTQIPVETYPGLWKAHGQINGFYYKGDDRLQEIDLWPQVVLILKNKSQCGAFSMDYIKSEFNMLKDNPQLKNMTDINGITKLGQPFYYYNYASAFSHVEVDCLTGEISILHSEVIYDAGLSINPATDIGQIEGAFVQGTGYHTCEELVYLDDGSMVSDSTFTYKAPTTTEIPQNFHVTLYSGHGTKWIDKSGVYSSKTTGEPPIVLSNTVYFAIRNAIQAYRRETLKTPDNQFPELTCPATTWAILAACQIKK